MSSPLQKKILKALFVTLKPLARLLLQAGIGYREFSEVAKGAFIFEATEGYGVRGRATNISRVSIMTGVARKEVKKIRENGLDAFLLSSINESPASVVLSRWHNDERFCDLEKGPKVLCFDHGENSFTDLVSSYAGDIPPGAMRTELKRIGAVSESEGKKLTVLKRYFVPPGVDDKLLVGLEDVVGSDLSTLAFNCSPEMIDESRFHRVVSIDGLVEDALPVVQREAKKRLSELANEFDDFLVDQVSSGDSKELSTNQVGIGLFYYERHLKYRDLYLAPRLMRIYLTPSNFFFSECRFRVRI
jgi:hypothetical protein